MKIKHLMEGAEPKLPGAVSGIKIMTPQQFVAKSAEGKEPEPEQGVTEGSGGNWYIRVNGKILNDTKFKPVIFSSEDEARSHAMKLADKKRIPLSQIKLTKSWMDSPEQGVAEAINPDITNPEFSHQQQIGDYLYVARYWSKGLKITAYHGTKKIGYAELMYQTAPFDDYADPKTTPKRVWLESEWTHVDPKYQRQGIMSTMYAYAKMLGNSVKPSQTRSDDAKAAWKSWRDAGDAQHLTREGVAEAGPFSYGKAPRKGSVADLAAKKRREQEKGKQPIEPRDQMVGVAKVIKGVAEATGNPGMPHDFTAVQPGAEVWYKGRFAGWTTGKVYDDPYGKHGKMVAFEPNPSEFPGDEGRVLSLPYEEVSLRKSTSIGKLKGSGQGVAEAGFDYLTNPTHPLSPMNAINIARSAGVFGPEQSIVQAGLSIGTALGTLISVIGLTQYDKVVDNFKELFKHPKNASLEEIVQVQKQIKELHKKTQTLKSEKGRARAHEELKAAYEVLDELKARVKSGVAEATKLPADTRELKGQELEDYLDRIRNQEKSKTDKYKLPYIHRSSVIGYYNEEGKKYDVDAIKQALAQRPKKLLKQNEKMKHSNGELEQFFNIGFAALVGIALDENTNELIVVNTCPGAGSCKVDCFAMKGGKIQFAGPWLSDGRILTYLLNDPDGFFNQLDREIKKEEKAGDKGGYTVTIRWHDAGDFFSPEYVDLAFKLARANPDVMFYAYTKMGDVVLSQKPGNFMINWSEGAHTSQEKKVKQADPSLATTKNSRIVPSNLFYDLLVKDEKKNLVKGSEGQWQVIPDKLPELKQRLAKQYGLSPSSILSYSEWAQKTDSGKQQTPVKYNVIITPGEPDITAKSAGVLSTLLLKH